MKAYRLLSVLIVLAILFGCKNKPGENAAPAATDSTQTATVQTPEPEVQPQQTYSGPDVAQDVLKLIDRSLISERINDSIYREATETKRVFDEYTSPYKISAMNGEGGIYNIVYVDCYPMLNDEGSYYVLFYTEAGVDGAVLDKMKTYTYKDGALTEVECPIKAPNFDEFFEGVEIPADLKKEVNYMKKEYASKKNTLHGLDLRHGEQDDCVLELRPSYIEDDRLWEMATPVRYEFNGTTFVKMK